MYWSAGCVLFLFNSQGCLGSCDVVNVELSEESQDLEVGEKRGSGVDDLRGSDDAGLNTIMHGPP